MDALLVVPCGGASSVKGNLYLMDENLYLMDENLYLMDENLSQTRMNTGS